jgi:hypothetical protein
MILRRQSISHVAVAAALATLSSFSSSSIVVQGELTHATCLSLLTDDRDDLYRDEFALKVYTHALTDVLDLYVFSQDNNSKSYDASSLYDSTPLRGTILKRNSDELRNNYKKYMPTWTELPAVVQQTFAQESCYYTDVQDAENVDIIKYCEAYDNGSNYGDYGSASVSSTDLPVDAKIPFGDIDDEDEDEIVSRRIDIGITLCDTIVDHAGAWYDLTAVVKASLETQGLLIPIMPSDAEHLAALEEQFYDDDSGEDGMILVVEEVMVEEDIVTTTDAPPMTHLMDFMFDIRVDDNYSDVWLEEYDLILALKEEVSNRANDALLNSSFAKLRRRLRIGTLLDVTISLDSKGALR